MVLHLPVVLAAVSEAVQNILEADFGRQALLIPNGVDCLRFQPGPNTRLPPTLHLKAPLPKGCVSNLVLGTLKYAHTQIQERARHLFPECLD